MGELFEQRSRRDLTIEEPIELKSLVVEFAGTQYRHCPVCIGSITSDVGLASESRCPHCESMLESYSIDVTGHEFHEVDNTIRPLNSLGVFTGGYVAVGTVPCFCGLIYPKNYSCCPGLLTTAIELHRTGSGSQQCVAIQFIDRNADSFVNALRGKFRQQLDSKRRKHLLRKMVGDLECGDQLKAILVNAT